MNKKQVKSRNYFKMLLWVAVLAIMLACQVTINTTPPTADVSPLAFPPTLTVGVLSTSTPYPTHTPYPTFTIAPPTLAPIPTDTLPPTETVELVTPTDDMAVSFVEITRSTNAFACGGSPSLITITAKVDNRPAVYYIDFFWQMIEKTTKEKTSYTDRNMDYKEGATWSITIQASMVPNPKHWTSAWFAYQLVMVNKKNDYIRSQYFADVDFKPCP